jgi:hypothetical protein
MCLQASRGLSEVGFAHDVVVVEDALRLVARQRHRDSIRDSGPNHISHHGAAKVVNGYCSSLLLRDRDSSYGPVFSKRVDAMDITEVLTAPRSSPRLPNLLAGKLRKKLHCFSCRVSRVPLIALSSSTDSRLCL